MTEDAGLAEAEANFLDGLADMIKKRANDLRETGLRITKESHEAKLIEKLEGLPFAPARSGKCDWVDHSKVPSEVLVFFDLKGDFKTESWHYRKMPDGNVLRFARSKEASNS